MKKLFLILVSIIIAGTLFISGCGDDETMTSSTTTPTSGTTSTASSTSVSSGEGAQDGDFVAVHYTGTLEEDGSKFDSSYDRNQPLTFTVGAGQMIAGFDEAVHGMEVGDTKTVTLPPEEAYGEWSETKIIQFDRSEFAEPFTYSVGDSVPLQTSSGYIVEYPIVEITDDYVAVDTNHELAGKTLIFEIEMMSITPAG